MILRHPNTQIGSPYAVVLKDASSRLSTYL